MNLHFKYIYTVTVYLNIISSKASGFSCFPGVLHHILTRWKNSCSLQSIARFKLKLVFRLCMGMGTKYSYRTCITKFKHAPTEVHNEFHRGGKILTSVCLEFALQKNARLLIIKILTQKAFVSSTRICTANFFIWKQCL